MDKAFKNNLFSLIFLNKHFAQAVLLKQFNEKNIISVK